MNIKDTIKRFLVIGITFVALACMFTAEAGLFKKKPKVLEIPIPVVVQEPVKPEKSTGLQPEESGLFIAIAPDIPESVEFCGQVIDLRRNDLRERFDREMLSMMYMHSTTLTLLKRANRYFPVIEPILKASKS
jgi:hypothetical protein